MQEADDDDDPGPREQLFDATAAHAALARCATARERLDAAGELLAQLSRLRRAVTRVLERMGADYHDAQDAVADALLALFQDVQAGTWRAAPRNWTGRLFWKARTCLHHNLRQHRRALRPVSHPLPTATDNWREFMNNKHVFEHVVAQMPTTLTPCEQHVVMARAAGLTYREVAAFARTTVQAARKHHAKALKKLKEVA